MDYMMQLYEISCFHGWIGRQRRSKVMAAELRKSGRAHDKAQGGKALGGWSRNGGRCDLDGGGAGGAGGGTNDKYRFDASYWGCTKKTRDVLLMMCLTCVSLWFPGTTPRAKKKNRKAIEVELRDEIFMVESRAHKVAFSEVWILDKYVRVTTEPCRVMWIPLTIIPN